mgnify:CR=1 FL=1
MVNFGPDADFELDPNTLDFAMVSGNAHTAMKCRQVFQTFQGEWWLEPTLGLPYHTDILGQKQPDLNAIRAIFVVALSGVPGISSITSLSVAFDNATRTFTVNFSAVAGDGTAIEESINL